MDEKFHIELSQSQIVNLMEFFEFEFIDSIRNNTDIDNLAYLVDMCEIYTKLKRTQEKGGEGKCQK